MSIGRVQQGGESPAASAADRAATTESTEERQMVLWKMHVAKEESLRTQRSIEPW